ncbi:hypothetical protein [Novosphingobium sp. B1]|uniref:hypothetical protein n=1 Tax=Novosphingobium sp. B1 TaxID=1938756 RepID=UPI0009D8989A|nr:hypothetical protein [Novosphingobium sp. B1]SMC30487.1 hypothetical protein SAMN06272759_10167 [Novosphingobium sp. B1]
MIRLMLPVTGLSVLLAACSEKEPTDAEAIAAVNAAQDMKPPVKPLDLQPILYPDITQNKLHGVGCAFVADGGGLGAVLLAQDKRGVIKVAEKVEVLAPDAGSAKLPKGSWSRYTGKAYAVTLAVIGEVKAVGATDQFKGKMIVTDAFERPAYEATGDVQCKAI